MLCERAESRKRFCLFFRAEKALWQAAGLSIWPWWITGALVLIDLGFAFADGVVLAEKRLRSSVYETTPDAFELRAAGIAAGTARWDGFAWN